MKNLYLKMNLSQLLDSRSMGKHSNFNFQKQNGNGLKIKLFITVLFLIISAGIAHATHAMGADITYKEIDTSIGRYRFTLTLYRDCSGIFFGSEQLTIRTATINTSVSFINSPKTTDVTPLCAPPDVASKPITNCPSGAIGLYKGVERSVYTLDYTLGKNVGWAYVGWGTCCRNNIINTITAPGTEGIWIQAVINTNFRNNSPVFTSTTVPNWCRLGINNYSAAAVDSFDEQFININGQSVLRDSIAYKLYTPFTGVASNINQAVNYNNPSVTFVSPLNSSNFLYTTTGVVFDPKSGHISCIPSIQQDAIISVSATEFRAVPNASGIGYTRQMIGYICRDLQFTVGNNCGTISFAGIIPDSIKNANYVSQNTIAMDQGRSNIKFSFKIIGSPGTILRSKVLKTPSGDIMKGFNYSQIVKTGATVDTLYGTVTIDSALKAGYDNFLLDLYYCNSIGIKHSQPYTMNLIVKQGYCVSIGDTPVFSNLNIKKVILTGGFDNIDNETSCNSLIGSQGTGSGLGGRYADFSNSTVPKTKLIKGSTFNLKIVDTACMSGWHYYTKAVFIDWNKNNNFLDAGERYNVSSSPFNLPTENINITVPSNVSIGKTKMRIVTRMDTPSSNLNPCGPTVNTSMNQGETEDYEIELVENFGDCKLYKQINYSQFGEKFHFFSSGPNTVISPYSVRYAWTFSTGQTSNLKNPVLDSFPHGKLNWAKLVICVDSASINICCDSSLIDSISNCKFSAYITRDKDTLKAIPVKGIAPYTYQWSNGSSSQTLITNTSGTYYVYVTDSVGCIAEYSYNLIGNSNLCANYRNFTWNNTSNNYTFYNSPNIPSGFYPTYYWTFGNGLWDTLAQPTANFNSNSSYTVKLKYCLRDSAKNIICCDSIQKVVQTQNSSAGMPCNVKANFTYTSQNDGTYIFSDSTSPLTGQMYTYLWTFGDGTSSTQKHPTKVYSTNGPKLVCLKVRRWLNSNNMYCEESICKTINVTNVVPCNRLAPEFTYNSIGNGQYTFQNITNMSNFNLISASYQILPTGTTYNTPNATHVFTTIGTYNVIMTITAFDILSGLNCTRSTSRTIYVNPSLCGCFKASNLATAMNKVVNFTNTSNCVDTNTKYLYKFGNGDTSTNANPTYTYPLPGLYRTVMYITRVLNGVTCKDSFIRILQVTTAHPCKDSGYAVYYNYSCPTFINPVCGCDSITYRNYCEAGKVGVKQYTAGPCKNDTTYVKICGYVINDLNKNCAKDTNDIPINNITIKVNTTPVSYAYTNASGYYQIYLPKGTYTLTQQLGFTNPAIHQLCPASGASITVAATAGGATYCNNHFYDTMSTCPDLSVSIAKYRNITPGFMSQKHISYSNRGATTISGVVLKYRFLSSLNVSTLTTSAYSVSGNVITWNLGSLPPYSNGSKQVYLSVPVSLPLGTTVIDSVWIEPSSGDCNPSNNYATFPDTCVGSYDPNDKAASPANNIDTGVKVIDYHIRFQNTGTAPAHNVRIEDKIDNNFEKESLKIHDYSHSMNHYFDDNGKLYFEFPNIMLPDSGTDYEASQGYVTYSIYLKKGLPVGTKLKNTAEIYFDFNEPIITNTTVNTITLKSANPIHVAGRGINLIVYPNPTKNIATIKTELANSSNVSYTLYDLQGRVILRKEDAIKPSGPYSEDINLEALQTGIYVLNLKINGHETSIKLIKE
jgi:uncharacterized repeat protein (TIGR01451 family)